MRGFSCMIMSYLVCAMLEIRFGAVSPQAHGAFQLNQTVSARSWFVADKSARDILLKLLVEFHLDGPKRVRDTVFPKKFGQLVKVEALGVFAADDRVFGG